MKVVVTGGSGFLGQRLARALLAAPDGSSQINSLVLADRVAGADLGDGRATYAVGDIAEPAFLASLITPDVRLVVHLAAVVSGQAEADFDLGLQVNIEGSHRVLDACRSLNTCPRVVFTSSVAVFGPTAPGTLIDDDTRVDPRSSYGMEKAVGELLLSEYSRRGFVDGVVLRLPTISVRPGRPNQAASSFASGIIREPLMGERAPCPAPDSTVLWLLSPRRAVDALARAAFMESGVLGANRVINLPGLSVTVAQMLAALEQVGGLAARALVYDAPDEAITRIVASWPPRWDDRRARSLGFEGDPDFAAIVQMFITEELGSGPRPA